MKSPLFAAILGLSLHAFAAEIPRALPTDELPKDARLDPLKELDGYFPFTPPATREAWEQRAEQVRMQVRVALGLWPEPTRTPLNAVVHGRIEGDDYTVEKVFFESMPGFFVTGTLFRPKTPGPHPAMLCAHGHWKDARFWIRTDAEMKKELESGGEALPESGRSIFQSIGVQLARMGVVAFVYDMLGNCDSQQISADIAHGFKKQRPEMNTAENWGLFSPQAEAHAQSIIGLQTWNSVRALDFLTSLPDVDGRRLGCTGASGGGTQTLMLAAVDSRLAVSIPCVMPSTAMQGGCTCENASLLRVGTGNVEIAALFAPKPQAMTTAKDWTIEMPAKGFPELQQLYELMGAKENVALWPHPEFPHNYNSVTRHHIYAWLDTHFGLGLPAEKLTERDFPLLTREQLTVWDAEHPAPAGGEDFERKLLKWWHEDAQAQLGKLPEVFARIALPGWKALLGARNVSFTNEELSHLEVGGDGSVYPAVLRRCHPREGGVELILLELIPPNFAGKRALWLDARGKAGLFTESGELRPEVCRLLKAGWSVEGADLFAEGEFLAPEENAPMNRLSKNPREAAAYTFGYNPPLFAQRVQDIIDCLRSLPIYAASTTARSLIALDETGPLAAAALAVYPYKIETAIINTGGFRFGAVLDLHSANFLPAAAKYGDVSGALALARRKIGRLLVLGEGGQTADPVAWLLEKAP